MAKKTIPNTWFKLCEMLRANGYNAEQLAAARVGYELGGYAALSRCAHLSNPDAVYRAWAERYPDAEAGAADALERSKR